MKDDAFDPLILTARFDHASAAAFQGLRDTHFPARLNIVPAHLTLFHKLPGHEFGPLVTTLRDLCQALPHLPYATAGLRFLGRGVAIGIDAPGLTDLHRRLAAIWTSWLVPQDRQPFRPHVTVQNKADPAAARDLRDRLAVDLRPMAGHIVGLDLWHYRGGPWAAAGTIDFQA